MLHLFDILIDYFNSSICVLSTANRIEEPTNVPVLHAFRHVEYDSNQSSFYHHRYLSGESCFKKSVLAQDKQLL